MLRGGSSACARLACTARRPSPPPCWAPSLQQGVMMGAERCPSWRAPVPLRTPEGGLSVRARRALPLATAPRAAPREPPRSIRGLLAPSQGRCCAPQPYSGVMLAPPSAARSADTVFLLAQGEIYQTLVPPSSGSATTDWLYCVSVTLTARTEPGRVVGELKCPSAICPPLLAPRANWYPSSGDRRSLIG